MCNQRCELNDRVCQRVDAECCWVIITSCVCVQTQQITPQLALQVLLQFDKAINTALASRVRNRVNFRVSPPPVTCDLPARWQEAVK